MEKKIGFKIFHNQFSLSCADFVIFLEDAKGDQFVALQRAIGDAKASISKVWMIELLIYYV